MFALFKGLVCLMHGRRCYFQGPQKEGAFQMCAWPPHTLQGRWAPGGLTSCGAQLAGWGAGETSAWSPPFLLERVRLALLNPQARGSQLGSAWETSSCWLGGLRLRIEISVLMTGAWGLSPASPWTTSNNNNRNSS